jgi:hypothetical protein
MSTISNHPVNNVLYIIQNLKEDFVVAFIYIIILIIIVLFLFYIYRVKNLENKECNFLTNIYGKMDGNIRPLNNNDNACKYKFYDYYIKTAYNCCSGGSYKNDFVSLCALKNLLKQGVRGLDFEIYSVNDKPVISTSTQTSYYIKETFNSVDFGDALRTIINYAFSGSTAPNPTDPIIIHLRVKSTNQKIYTAMANLFETYNNYFLGKEYSFENQGQNLGLVNLLTLCGKIVLIVDRINTAFAENTKFTEYVNITSDSIFMRALMYNDIKLTPDVDELINYNKTAMTIALPDKGINPPNPNAMVVRESGCQMIAMRYELVDIYLEENIAFFDKAGYAFVLKPERLRYVPVTNPIPTAQEVENSYATRNYATDYYNFNI